MKNLLLFIILTRLLTPSVAQNLYNAKWMVGISSNAPQFYFGGTMLDFLSPSLTPVFYNVPAKYSADKSLTMSDSAGNLQFFTNGCRIMSWNNEEMENGDSLNPGAAADVYCGPNNRAYESYNALLAIPYPGHYGEYLLFHSAWENYSSSATRTIFYYTHIDMNANGGLGKVVAKNQMLNGPEWTTPATSAVRHANGRDWWVMQGGYNSHIFRRWLVTPQGVGEMKVLDWNSLWTQNQLVNLASCFSPDGTKYVRPTNSKPPRFFVFDFDRCNGELSNPVALTTPDTLMNWSFPIFSPNSRFLYIADRITTVYQYDLAAPDINASVVKAGEWDGVYDTTLTIDVVTGFHKMAHGLDGKIYICSYNHTIFLHVINQPNEKGPDCQFELRGVTLPVRNKSLPNYPNYQLYDVSGSACDTLGINDPATNVSHPPVPFPISISPNPATDRISLTWPKDVLPMHIVISDVTGRIVSPSITSIALNANSASFDISQLASGIYWIRVYLKNGETGTGVFSVIH